VKITREDVVRVAELAYLDLSEDELEKYRRQIDEILDYIGKLNELDTSGVEPMAQVLADDQEQDQAAQVGPVQPVAEGEKRDQSHPEDHLGCPQQHPPQRTHRHRATDSSPDGIMELSPFEMSAGLPWRFQRLLSRSTGAIRHFAFAGGSSRRYLTKAMRT